MTDSAMNLLGLALRGGNLAVGEEPVAEACRAHRARVVLLAQDAGPSTARRGEKFAGEGGVPLVRLPCSKADLGWSLGRASCALAAVTEAGLASAVMKKLAVEDESLTALAQELEERARRGQKRRRDSNKTARAGKKPADVEA